MDPLADRAARLRAFNRFYTRRIGVLDEGFEATSFTLAESRLLWELAQRGTSTASELALALDLDPGYLSRLLRRFRQRGLLRSARAKDDARQVRLTLSAAGRKAFAPLDAHSQSRMRALLEPLGETAQRELLAATQTIERLLAPPGERAPSPFVLRAQRPGDIGWVISRHGALYAAEYGWDARFEALVGHIASRFIEQFDPAREACWIAERDCINVGCVFLVQSRDEASDAPVDGVAQLRLLLVEPSARGAGLGDTLIHECERFARHAGYRTIRLWTNSVLLAARHLYAKHGYRLVASEPHESFGKALVGETWELALQ
ncbi:MAG TPA: helix-turn-helix domain-containing GNAT family N-acetyltransferase [Ideonella sp.]|nr:helix-turn-helix domain-containing GNAT family N-acetyltransferase [Ideonella sp.]